MTAIITTLLGLAAAAAVASPGGGGHRRFVARVDNPWFPLIPGSHWRYRGVKDGKRAVDVVVVKRGHERILGARATVVSDRLYLAGRLAERTTDWYAQDTRGNVWYLGEATAELDRHGHVVSREGSWRAGVHGARAGIYMPAHPRVGMTGRQEYLRGHAEDHFRVVSRHARVRVPWGSSRRALETHEWTPLEPGVLDAKYYVRGVGTVKESTVRGPTERLELVSFSRGRG